MTEGDDQFHCSLGGKLLPKRANSTQLVVTGSGLINDVLYEQCAVLHQDKGLERERERFRERERDRDRERETERERETNRQKQRQRETVKQRVTQTEREGALLHKDKG